jgi:tRNA nucleotidyltransferase (CCA-adding enzyme)
MALKMYVTGGTLRDRMLGLKPKDMDYSVEAPSYAAMVAEAMGGTVWQLRPEFLTVRGKLPGVGDADFVMCRKEGFYSDGRHPDTVEPGTVLDDLARRDFTVNAMAQADGGPLLDPFDGQGDLARRVLRCVGNPVHRFSEDSLRMVRALRFSVTRGFTLDIGVAAALTHQDLLDGLDNCAVERVREEMFKAFACDTLATLKLLERFPRLRDKVFSRGLKLTPTLGK